MLASLVYSKLSLPGTVLFVGIYSFTLLRPSELIAHAS